MDRRGDITNADAETIRNLRREVTNLRVSAELRNRQLDALGVVWCDGGCTGGMHRFSPDREVTPAMIADLVRNADRAVRWYVNHAGRRATDKQAAWQAARDDLIEHAAGDMCRIMIKVASGLTPEAMCRDDAPLEEMETADLVRAHGRLSRLILARFDNGGPYPDEEAAQP